MHEHDLDLVSTNEGTKSRLEPIVCIECRRIWLDPAERWRIYVLHDEKPPEAVAYCNVCATREFG